MRRLLSLLFTLFLVTTMSAQSANDHLRFKGVPLDGNLTEFVTKMNETGFKTEIVQDGVAIMSGNFAGHKDCKIIVITVQPKNIVHKVAVMFPQTNSWEFLIGSYNKLKVFLTKKYGQPEKCVEQFEKGYVPKNDIEKLTRLMTGGCQFVSCFSNDRGLIELSLFCNEIGTEPCVRLIYQDRINTVSIDK